MRKGWIGLLAAVMLCYGGYAQAQPCPIPEGIAPSAICEVTMDGQPVMTQDTRVNLRRIWTSRPMTTMAPVCCVAMQEKAEFCVRFIGKEIVSAVVRPLALGITPVISGDTVTFTVQAPAYMTVEINGGQENALHLFADAPIEPVPAYDNTIVYEAGIHEAGTVRLTSGQSVYLAPGAYVRGQFVAADASGITISGLGVIDGSTFDRFTDTLVPIDLTNCKNVSISGVCVLDPAAWTVNLYHCEDVTIDHIKIIGACSNSDGISVQSCKRVSVSNSFIRGWDDNLVVKGYDGDVSDISFANMTLWTDLAQSCEIGYETRAEVIERVTFENITVLHANHKPVISIHNSDQALVRDVFFRDFVVEDCNLAQGDGAPYLIDLTTIRSQWSKSKERGRIDGVLIENVAVLAGKKPTLRIFAPDKEHSIDHVTIKGLTLMGESITSFDQLRYTYSPRKLGESITIE